MNYKSLKYLLIWIYELQKPKMGKKKRKNKDFLEDLVDLGDGYDENDTFIDNSEAVSIFEVENDMFNIPTPTTLHLQIKR